MSTAELAVKLEALSQEDYDMVVMLVNRLSDKQDKPSDILKRARERYVKQNPMTMQEIDDEIENYRSGKTG